MSDVPIDMIKTKRTIPKPPYEHKRDIFFRTNAVQKTEVLSLSLQCSQ